MYIYIYFNIYFKFHDINEAYQIKKYNNETLFDKKSLKLIYIFMDHSKNDYSLLTWTNFIHKMNGHRK